MLMTELVTAMSLKHFMGCSLPTRDLECFLRHPTNIQENDM